MRVCMFDIGKEMVLLKECNDLDLENIPKIGEYVAIDQTHYEVKDIIHDYDDLRILIFLKACKPGVHSSYYYGAYRSLAKKSKAEEKPEPKQEEAYDFSFKHHLMVEECKIVSMVSDMAQYSIQKPTIITLIGNNFVDGAGEVFGEIHRLLLKQDSAIVFTPYIYNEGLYNAVNKDSNLLLSTLEKQHIEISDYVYVVIRRGLALVPEYVKPKINYARNTGKKVKAVYLNEFNKLEFFEMEGHKCLI